MVGIACKSGLRDRFDVGETAPEVKLSIKIRLFQPINQRRAENAIGDFYVDSN